MRLYLDENASDRLLAALLRRAGHDVLLSPDVPMTGASDPVQFAFAIRDDRAILTYDYEDFHDLHELILAAGGEHKGVIVIRREGDPARDMKPAQIVAALARLEQSGMDITNEYIVLNHWR